MGLPVSGPHLITGYAGLGRKESKCPGLAGSCGTPFSPPGASWSLNVGTRAPGRPALAPFCLTPVPGHSPRLAMRTCACSRREKISTKECVVQAPADRMGPPEREQARRGWGDGSWEGKQRCARQQARQRRASHCSQSHGSGALGRGRIPASAQQSPRLPRPACLPLSPDPELRGPARPRKEKDSSSVPPTNFMASVFCFISPLRSTASLHPALSWGSFWF